MLTWLHYTFPTIPADRLLDFQNNVGADAAGLPGSIPLDFTTAYAWRHMIGPNGRLIAMLFTDVRHCTVSSTSALRSHYKSPKKISSGPKTGHRIRIIDKNVKVAAFQCPQVASQFHTENCFPATNPGLILE
jgi:hypothetical protein